MPLVFLPNELLLLIAGYLDTRDIASFRSTNKNLAAVLRIPLYDSIYSSGSSDSARKALYYAVAKKDYWLVSRLIGQRVGTLVGDGALLNHAIRRNCSEETIRTFIDCGEKVNEVDRLGVTPLAAAAARGRLDVVELLLSRGADVKVGNMPNCPFWWAARSGHLDIFRVLHNYPGVELNSVDYYGRSLLHWMTFLNCPAAVSVLIQSATVDVNKRDMCESTPLAVAAEMGYNHIARILLSNGRTDANLGDVFANTPLHKAVRRGNVDLVQILMENDRVDRTPINRSGMSPLMLARSCGRQAVVNLIEGYIT